MMSSKRSNSKHSKKDDRRVQRRESIIRTATKLFAQYGYDDCDMECVAAQLRIAKGTLYLYFRAKQDLFFACVDQAMKELQETIRVARSRYTDLLLQISSAIRAYVVFFTAHPEYVELMVLERAIFRDRKHATYFKYRERNREFWKELYKNLIKNGTIRTKLSSESLLDMIGNLVYGTMFTNHFQGTKFSITQQHKALVTFAFCGIVSPNDLTKLVKVR